MGLAKADETKIKKLIEKFSPNQQPSTTLVVFFSCSGNTEVMARKIAQLTGADILSLQSAHNQIGVVGWQLMHMMYLIQNIEI